MTKALFVLIAGIMLALTVSALLAIRPQASASSLLLSAAPGGRYLQTASGDPFLVLGDGAQAVMQNLPLTGSSSGDANANLTYYFSTRQTQGFNSIWGTLVCSLYSACLGNDSHTYDSLVPFNGTLSSCGTTIPDCWDMTTAGQGVSAAYWNRMDAIINLAAQYGHVMFLNPVTTGGCNTFPSAGSNPLFPMIVNNHNTTSGGHTNAYAFGQFLGNRYKSFTNIVWLHGDDYICNGQGGGTPAADDAPVVDMMNGITAAGDTHLQTIELWSVPASTAFDNADFLPSTGQVNLNGVYTYYPNYDESLHGWNQGTAPNLMLETNYEWGDTIGAEPNDSGCAWPYTGGDCLYTYAFRKQFYESQLAGANAGILTGQAPIGSNGFCVYPSSTCPGGTGWVNYLNSTGMQQAGYWLSLIKSVPWQSLVPDQSNTFVTGGRGTQYPTSSQCTLGGHANCITPDNYVTAASYSTSSVSGLLVYIPCYSTRSAYGCTGTGGVTVSLNAIGTNLTARWYDPTNGTYTAICSPSGTACGTGSHTFTPTGANSAGDSDWVLVITGKPSAGLMVTFTGTAQPAASSACSTTQPAPAAAAGYNVMTLGPCVNYNPSGGGDWCSLHGAQCGCCNGEVTYVTNNSDGSVTISGGTQDWGGGTFGGQLASRKVFGKGFYAEATWSYTGSPNPGGPAWWTYGSDGTLLSNGNWNTDTSVCSLGCASHSIEADMNEEITGDSSTYQATMHVWGPGSCCNVQDVQQFNADNSAHRYGMLYVPATPSSGGFVQWYLDGSAVGYRYNWNYGDTGNWGEMDYEYQVLFFSNGNNHTMRVYDVQVWQASSDNVKCCATGSP